MHNRRSSENGVVRIGRHEALSTHVDDLLSRQKSLRGDADQARRRKSRWYYRSWFVFMVAGGSGAFAAWAVLEPYYDDHLYFQGVVETVDWTVRLPVSAQAGEEALDISFLTMGTLTIRGERIWLIEGMQIRRGGGAWRDLQPDAITVGQEVGVYLDYFAIPGDYVALATFLVVDPPAQSARDATLTLRQLNGQVMAAGLVLFGLVAGLIGLAIGAIDGLMCRLPRRAFVSGGIGLAAGFIGGFVAGNLAELVYAPLSTAAMAQMNDEGRLTTFGFVIQMLGRGMAWACAGMAMGLGQGLALRSKRLLLYGFLGGIIGGMLGGLVFDPIDFLLLDPIRPSAHWSRMAGIVIVGMSVGVMIGVVELLARDAWLRMTEGPLAGKEFLIFKDLMRVGASPRADIYLFNDPAVAAEHANLRMVGDEAEIENLAQANPVEINGRPVDSARLRHGDQIRIGRTSFVFEKRRP
jgi:hypothetical protein